MIIDIILFTVSITFLGYYISMLFGTNFEDYLINVYNKTSPKYTKNIGIAEAVFLLVGAITAREYHLQLVMFIFLAAWFLGWALFMPVYTLVINKNIRNLFINLTVFIYWVVSFILGYKIFYILWIKMTI